MLKLPKCEEERNEAMAAFIRGCIQRGGETLGEIDRLRARIVQLENENVKQGAILESIIGALKGEEPSDFMISFPDVYLAWWVYCLAYPGELNC